MSQLSQISLEALTNALKYAHGSRTVVRVNYGEREITVEVGNDGSGQRAGSPGGSGRGLAGLSGVALVALGLAWRSGRLVTTIVLLCWPGRC